MNFKLPERYGYITLQIFLLSVFSQESFSQKNHVSGVVKDTSEKKTLQFAVAALIDLSDTTLYKSVRTDEKGVFTFTQVPSGRYTLMISYPRMADYLLDIEIKDTTRVELGELTMVNQAALLEEVIVQASAAIRMKGDTLEYRADSFYVKPGSSVEALLKRLPGITVNKKGQITAQGEEVKKILVDGDEFFADDPKLATRYLGAGTVDKVQVYDAKSETSLFTGVDDGKTTKTINLKLKGDQNNGHFGKLSAGSDGGKNYSTEAIGAIFKKNMKVAAFGFAARTGKEGVNGDEMRKYVPMEYEMIDDGTGNVMYYGRGEDDENYEGNGIPSVVSGGANYSNSWKNKAQKISSSYRVKNIDATGWSNGNTYTVLPDGSSFSNTSRDDEGTSVLSNKAKGSFTTPLDSSNTTLQLSANGGMVSSRSQNTGYSSSLNEKNVMVNNSGTLNNRTGINDNFESNATLRKKFMKPGRTFSLSLQQSYQKNNKEDLNYSENNYFDPTSGTLSGSDILDQLQQTNNVMQSWAAKATYSDKINERWNYNINYGYKNVDVQNIFNTFNNKDGKYNQKVDSLSIAYDFNTGTHLTGISAGWHKDKLRFTAGSDFYVTTFRQENRNIQETTNRDFVNFAPRLSATIAFKNKSVSVNYSGRTRQPDVEQLQPVRRSNNPLYSNIGNPDLRQEFRNDLQLWYMAHKPAKSRMFYVSGYFSLTDNAITTSSTTDENGKRTMQYINMNGNYNYSINSEYSIEFKKQHIRASINGDISRLNSNSVINGSRAKNSNLNFDLGPRITYTVPEKLDLTYSSTVSYSLGKTSFNNTVNKTWQHRHNIELSGELPHKFEVATDAVLTFQPKNSIFPTPVNVIMWNANVKKKLLKDEKGEIMFSVNDLLNKNTGYNRSVYGNTISENTNLVLKRYFLLTFTWNFSSMK